MPGTIVELVLPRELTRVLGLRGHEALVRSYGLREIGIVICSGMLARQKA